MRVDISNPREWNEKKFLDLTIAGRVYSCWQPACQGVKAGDEIEGEIVDKGPGKTPQIKISSINGAPVQTSGKSGYGGGGKPPARVESFACAYAKDIAVALINVGVITPGDGAAKIKSTIDFFYKDFMEKMK